MSEKRRVLVVDDEPAIVKMLSKWLEHAGFEVLVATNGQDGLTKARLGHPEVILLDLMLPQVSGLEICAALKQDERHRHIPIIVFTGKGTPMDEQLCREIGADAYINKPQGMKTLIEQVEALLGRVIRQAPRLDAADQQTTPGST